MERAWSAGRVLRRKPFAHWPGELTIRALANRLVEGDQTMHIKQKTSQHRRDFTAIYQCEHCDHEATGSGYDDLNFHQNAIPAMPCQKCGKTADELTPKTVPDVPEGVTI